MIQKYWKLSTKIVRKIWITAG